MIKYVICITFFFILKDLKMYSLKHINRHNLLNSKIIDV